MTIFNLHLASPHLVDVQEALENLQGGTRVGVRDQNGSIYRIDSAIYDSARMAVVFQIDTTNPIVLSQV